MSQYWEQGLPVPDGLRAGRRTGGLDHAQEDIMPFYKIRRYVPRAGRRLGCTRDSSSLPEEHPMIIYLDCLLLDGTDCILEAYVQRRQRLADLVGPLPGRAVVGEYTLT